MAGFILRNINDNNGKGLLSNIQRNIRSLSSLGMKWDDNLVKQSKSIGATEAQFDNTYNLYGSGLQANYLGSDYGQKEFIAFYDQSYSTRREFLRRFAMNGEIEHVLDVIADESIIYDTNNFFAYPDTKTLKNVLKAEKAKEIVDDLNEAFKKIYFAFGFNEGHDAWHYLKKFLIDGFLAFEIIYDENEKGDAENVIGFKEIDAISLEPELRKNDDGKEYRVWIQYRGDANRQRELVDANVIYLSWARANFISRLSYVERLVRSFNMLRTLENSRIIWNTWNAQYRMKIIVPIGTQSEAKARTRLSELRAMYKEELTIDSDSGEIAFNGQPNFSFFKTYIIPDAGGSKTELDSFAPAGYDLNSTEQLKYFWMRFINETKVPNNRFRLDINAQSSGSWGAGAEALQREELSFSYFINRVRSIFQEIVMKPAWIQFCLKHPEFKNDRSLKSSIGLTYIEENLFKQIKQREIAEKMATTFGTLLGLKEPTINPDGTMGDENIFDPKFIIEKFGDFSDSDMKLNLKYKRERKEQMRQLMNAYKRIQKAEGDSTMMAGGMGGGFSSGGDLGLGDMGLGGGEMPTETPTPETGGGEAGGLEA